MSIVIAVGGMMLAATLPGGDSGGEMNKTRITLQRMEAIENATMQFMTANQRRPYPSNLTVAFDSASFGVEMAAPTDFSSTPTTHFTRTASGGFTRTAGSTTATSGTTSTFTRGAMVSGTSIPTNTWVEAISSATDFIMNKPASGASSSTLYLRHPMIAGGVPVKTLGLPDEYAMDGFGRRIVYVVDARVTVKEGCMALQNNNIQGGVQLSSSSTFSTGVYDHVMWALLSYGQDGQGATSMQGAGLDARIKTGNTDASTLTNAFYDNSQNRSFTYGGLVNKATTSTFDDIVWVNPQNKNTCGMGQIKSFRDFRINGGGNGDGRGMVTSGDINGDGWPDIVLGVPQQNLVRVIYGKKDSWPEPNTAYTSSAVDGTTGFSIVKGTTNISNFGQHVFTGDINGDGYDDVIAGGTPTSGTDAGYAVTFGSRSPASSMDISGYNGTTGFRIAGLGTSVTSWAAVGDINGDKYDDIALPFDLGSNNWAQGVLYGKASGFSNVTFNTTLLNGTNGVYFNVATPNATNGDVGFYTQSAANVNLRLTAMCDITGDGIKDLVIPGVIINDATSEHQRFYIKAGASSWANSSGLIDPSAAAVMWRFPTASLYNFAGRFNFKSIGCKDFASVGTYPDGYDDLFMLMQRGTDSYEYFYIQFGSAAPAGTAVDAAYNIRMDSSNTNAYAGHDLTTIPVFNFADVNNDGRQDILFSRSNDDPWFSITGSNFALNATATGTQRSNAGLVYVIYQDSTTWTSATATHRRDIFLGSDYAYDGVEGIKIVGTASDTIVAGDGVDMNKDGKTDLLVSTAPNPTGAYVLFGNTTWPATYDVNCTRDKTGAHCPNQLNTK